MFLETQPTLLDSSLHWLLPNSLMPMTQLLIAVFNSALLTMESTFYQAPQHVLPAVSVSSTILLKDVVSVKLVFTQFNKLLDKVPEALNAIPALHLSVKHVFKPPLLSVIAVLAVLLPMPMEIVPALQDFTKTVLFALPALINVLPAESEEYAILVPILLPEA